MHAQPGQSVHTRQTVTERQRTHNKSETYRHSIEEDRRKDFGLLCSVVTADTADTRCVLWWLHPS